MAAAATTVELVRRVVARSGGGAGSLLQVLRQVQAEGPGWLPVDLLQAVADALGVTVAQARAVASFYHFLYLSPRGHWRVLYSDNIVDRMAGSEARRAELCRALGVMPDTPDPEGVWVSTTSCTGLSDQAPGLLVNGRAVGRVDRDRMREIAALIAQRVAVEQWPGELFRIDMRIERRGPLLARRGAAGCVLSTASHMGAEGILAALTEAGLRGRGGAGFPTGPKWRACRQAPGSERIVVCNADEGEPGTFKDRVLLQGWADAVFEGMTLCALAIGARRGFVYLRGEYAFLAPALEATLARRRADGWLGEHIAGRDGWGFDIAVHMGAGAYICGEESALIESLEGRRGVPRLRPPFPVEAGYLGLPTVVDNVETFAAAALVVAEGAERYRAVGTQASCGSKLLAVSGDCPRSGVYEYPFGVQIRQVLEDCGAPDAGAVQVGGPSGTLVGPAGFGRRLAFEDIPCAGAFTVFRQGRDMLAVVRNFTEFFARESCGFCTPCRVGVPLLRDALARRAGGCPLPGEEALLARLEAALPASHCGLGRSASNPLRDLRRGFPEAWATGGERT